MLIVNDGDGVANNDDDDDDDDDDEEDDYHYSFIYQCIYVCQEATIHSEI